MKVLTIIKYAFTVTGSIALLVAAMLYLNTRALVETGVMTQGTVVDFAMVESDRSSSSSGVSIRATTHSYAPVVKRQVAAENGHTYQFTSSTSTYPPAYDVGETVSILYHDICKLQHMEAPIALRSLLARET